MASLRFPGCAPRLAIQRLNHMNGLVHSSSTTTTVFPRLSLFNQNQARFQSGIRVTAFEQAMEELYGHSWKEKLNNRQMSYVTFHERQREKRRQELQKAASGAWGSPLIREEYRQPEAEWRQKVEKKKADIRWQQKLARFNYH
ncbi:hypothetical protein VMCG_07046 [Cytospora schulzeri]|uniref:Uncharacterized protein n=1 Tax=Cytospora schulzeri TaxID=448051 RepID=A0A423W3S4_9PEZI|nr:hypothetical protein VMCG_07046 [Valsa malicola]